MFFGSDYPLITPDRWLADFEKINLRQEVRPLILKENAIKLLSLDSSSSATEQITRGEELVDLFKHVQQTNELPDGYAFRFLGSDLWANRLLQFINYERSCCPFFTFALIFEPEQGPIWLHVRGPGGVKDIIQHMVPPSDESHSQGESGS